MKALLLALRELKQAMAQIAFSEAILESAIVLLIAFIICVLINLPILFGFIPGALFFIHNVTKKYKDVRLEYVEEKFPELNEQLRAAANNLYKQNDMVNALHQDVLELLRKVKTASFIKFKTMWRELVTIAVLAYLWCW